MKFQEYAGCHCRPFGKRKFTYLKNSRWRTDAILEIENLLYFCNRSSSHYEILREYADWGRKQRGKLKCAYFKNLRWRTAAILEIENSVYLRRNIAYLIKTKFCKNMQIGTQTTGMVKICIFLKFKMADGRHIGNWKFAIFPQPFNRSRQNFALTWRLRL